MIFTCPKCKTQLDADIEGFNYCRCGDSFIDKSRDGKTRVGGEILKHLTKSREV